MSLESFPAYPIQHLLDYRDYPNQLYRCHHCKSVQKKVTEASVVFAGVILQRLHLLAEYVYPQLQSGYRKGRSTIDGIFALRQLMEKTREQRRCLYMAFVDFVKAVDRELLFIILGKLFCPPSLPESSRDYTRMCTPDLLSIVSSPKSIE